MVQFDMLGMVSY